MTRVSSDPSSCEVTIHRNCTDTQPILTRTTFLPSLTDPLVTSRLTDPAMHHSTQRTALVTHCTQMFLRKNAWIIIHGLYVQSESANTALEHKFLQKKQEVLIVLLILLLSLSLCPPIAMSQTIHQMQRKITFVAKTLATQLPYSLLFSCFPSDTQSPFFSSPLASSRSFLQSSNAVPFFPLHPQLRRLHESSSINASRHAQSCTHHTAQKQVSHAFPCNNDGAPSQQDG